MSGDFFHRAARQGLAIALAASALTTEGPIRAGVAAGASPAAALPAGLPMSVLLITLDTTRADHLGCYGATTGATPRLDALAREGTVFLQAVSPAPLTLVSHCSLMTGLDPRRHGVRDNESFRLGPGPATLAERLAKAGWTTAGFVSSVVLDRGTGIARGFARFDDSVRVGERSAFNYEERAASQTNAAVLSSLATLKPPFFLWVHYYDPHLPYVPPDRFARRFPSNPYDGEIAFMDEGVGRLLDEMVRRGLTSRCLVVVAGDHGESLGERGEAAHDVYLYQATQRVPLIVRGPGIVRGAVRQRVGLVDVMPTVLDLLGQPPEAGNDGRSLATLLRGGKARPGEARDFRIESWFPAFHYGWPPVRGLISGDFKLIDTLRPELYDLEQDPHERQDLSASNPELLARLRRRLGPPDFAPPAEAASIPEDAAAAERRRALSSLGYLSGAGPSAFSTPADPIDPKDGMALVALMDKARASLQGNRPEEATGPLKEVLGKNPRNLPARTMYASALLGSGRTEEAIDTYHQAVALAPNMGFVHFGLASALAERARQLRSAARLGQPSATGSAGAGESGRGARADSGTAPPSSLVDRLVSEARGEYRKVLAENPRDAEAALGLSRLELDAGRVEASREALLAARGVAVEDPEVELMLGILEAGRGARAEAAAAFERSLKLNPASPEAHVAAGRLAWSAGDARSAADHYQESLRLRPDAPLARTLGSILLEGLGDRQGALRAWRTALQLEPTGPDADAVRDLIRDLEEGKP